jgi:hypothetical protein
MTENRRPGIRETFCMDATSGEASIVSADWCWIITSRLRKGTGGSKPNQSTHRDYSVGRQADPSPKPPPMTPYAPESRRSWDRHRTGRFDPNPTFTTSPAGGRIGWNRPFASGSPLRPSLVPFMRKTTSVARITTAIGPLHLASNRRPVGERLSVDDAAACPLRGSDA